MKIFDFKVRILASLIKKRAPFNADYFVGGQKKNPIINEDRETK